MVDERMKSALAPLTRESVARGGSSSFRIRGGSMRPWLREGMRVQLEPIDLDRVRVGDVVAFALAGGLVAHRVIAIVRHAPVPVLRTKGDACIAADPPVRFEDVVGRVARVETSTRIIDLRTTRSRLAGLAIAGCSLMVAAARAVVGRLRARI